ncbi:MAG: MATE family efflux transporter [Hespellia sp.]|nr:MATE family efflux transporter [Hespellia sp.]
MTIRKTFAKYVSQNVLGMIGISLYILADTFFISMVEGANGITALNLVLPVYNLIFAIGAMMGVGAAIRFTILRAGGNERAEFYFSNVIFFALILGAVFMVAGGLFPEHIVSLMGGDETIVAVGAPYTRIFMLFTPFFMWNHICNAFVRNDGDPTVAMAATLGSSLFNIVMDYILMFPLGLGMRGAALATAVSPVIGILICCIHFFSKRNTIHFRWSLPSVRRLFESCQLGVSAFIGEFASGVTTIVFNLLILGLAGNVGVAAYGVIANTSLVAISVFNGVSQGSQPLFSELYGKGKKKDIAKVLRMAAATSTVLAVLILILTNLGAEGIVGIFNSEHDAKMAEYAVSGLRLYFIGFIFAGFNIVVSGYFSAVAEAKWAFITSILRGVVAIIACAVILSMVMGLRGVWLAFPAAEALTSVVAVTALSICRKKKEQRN